MCKEYVRHMHDIKLSAHRVLYLSTLCSLLNYNYGKLRCDRAILPHLKWPNSHCHYAHANGFPLFCQTSCPHFLRQCQTNWNYQWSENRLASNCTTTITANFQPTIRAEFRQSYCKSDPKDVRYCHFEINIYSRWKLKLNCYAMNTRMWFLFTHFLKLYALSKINSMKSPGSGKRPQKNDSPA